MSRSAFLCIVLIGLTRGGTSAQSALPPANDDCSKAVLLSARDLPWSTSLDTTGATEDPGDPVVKCVSPAPGKTVYYTFAPSSSVIYELDARASSPRPYQPVISVYTGTCGNFSPVADACGVGYLRVPLTAGITYTLVVAGAPYVVDPGIKVAINGSEICSRDAGPSGGDCGTTYRVKVGDLITVRAYNDKDKLDIPPGGSLDWTLGFGADPLTGSGAAVTFRYTAPFPQTDVVLTYTPPGGSPISRTVTMIVSAPSVAAAPSSAVLRGLAAGDVAVLPSPGGLLKLSVQKYWPSFWRGYIVPSVASMPNRAGSSYASDVWIANVDSSETTVGLELWTAAGQKRSDIFSLPVGGSRLLPDVVKGSFGLDATYGALFIAATGKIAAGARTFAPAGGGGSNGQFLMAYDISDLGSTALLKVDENALFVGARQDADFRTNVGIVNVISSGDCLVDVGVKDESGAVVGSTLTVSVPPYRYVQVGLIEVLPDATLKRGTVTLHNRTTDCLVTGVAYVIDNVSQDPIAIPIRKTE